MGVGEKDEKAAICTIRNFVPAKRKAAEKISHIYHTMDSKVSPNLKPKKQRKSQKDNSKIQSRIPKITDFSKTQNGGTHLQNGIKEDRSPHLWKNCHTVSPNSAKLQNGIQKMQNGGLKILNDSPKLQNDKHESEDLTPKTFENDAEVEDSNSSNCGRLLQNGSPQMDYGSPNMATPNFDLQNGCPRMQKDGLERKTEETQLKKADSDASVNDKAQKKDNHEKFPNGGLKIQNGGPFLKSGTYHKFKDEKDDDDDSIEFDFSTSSITQSQSSAPVECTSNKSTLIKTIICGQILSLTLCGVGTTSAALAKWYNVRVPGFQAFLTYTLICLTAGTKLAFDSKKFKEVIKERGWKYLLLGIADVEANFLLVKAYTFTTLTSAQLCDSFTIPTVLVLSCLILRVRYRPSHYIGVILCVSGAVCLIFIDNTDKQKNAKNELLGDFLSISGAFLYGCSNVAQEFIVRSFSKTEFLGMIGIICSILSGLQAIIVERHDIMKIDWNWHVVLLVICFVICQYMYYTLMPWVITLSSATVVNLSLLTSDLYTLMFGLFLFGYKFSYLYFIAFAGIFIGLVIYNWKPTPVSPRRTRKANRDIKKLEEECPLNLTEKQTLFQENKVGKYQFTTYTNGYANDLISTEV